MSSESQTHRQRGLTQRETVPVPVPVKGRCIAERSEMLAVRGSSRRIWPSARGEETRKGTQRKREHITIRENTDRETEDTERGTQSETEEPRQTDVATHR